MFTDGAIDNLKDKYRNPYQNLVEQKKKERIRGETNYLFIIVYTPADCFVNRVIDSGCRLTFFLTVLKLPEV